MNPTPGSRRRSLLLVAAAVAFGFVVTAGVGMFLGRRTGLPAPGSARYEETARAFFRGLAKLEVGLLDDAARDLGKAAALAPGEPVIWADLALVHLRLGSLDAAAPEIARAAELAPKSGDVAFLQSRLASLRGDRDAAIADLRRAVELDPANLQARTALVQEVENAGGSGANDEAQRLLEELFARQPENLAVLVERARLAAKRGDQALLADSLRRIEPAASGWPAQAMTQFRAAQAAASTGELTAAARAMTFLRNVLAQVPAYRESRRLVTPLDELVARPLVRFERLAAPSPRPSPADEALTFGVAPLGDGTAASDGPLVAVSLDGEHPPAVFTVVGGAIRRLDRAAASLPFPLGAGGAAPPRDGLLALDWNHDHKMDLLAAGAGGVRLYLQGEGESFRDATPPQTPQLDATEAWAADVEMDGDLDVVVGVRGAPPTVLRNDGDGSWTAIQPFPGVIGARAFAWADFDDDGDPDAALLDGAGAVHVLANLQGGKFAELPGVPGHGDVAALAAGDLDGDGAMDLVTLEPAAIRRLSRRDQGWSDEAVAEWQRAGSATAPARGEAPSLVLADLDNNGALDVAIGAGGQTSIWLTGEDGSLYRAHSPFAAAARAAVDLDGDGQLDLVGTAAGRVVRSTGRSTKGYHFHVIRPRAQDNPGDQRINSFGIGGTIEARAGLLAQKRVIDGPMVHFGLGARDAVDVTRVVWPNGVAQAEFDPAVDRPVVAEQRLKGSCPWVFAFDGTAMRFVTDFLWRSPLGLRINASDTAGVTQTEDWVKVRGDQLRPRDGAYDVRISTELWETHFVDRAALMVVDHSRDVEVYVDERFVPAAAPALALHATRAPQPLAGAWDDTGADVTALVARRDGRTVASFPLGDYQGVAGDHFLELDLGRAIPAEGPAWLVAQGWIYPTDSSINVALGQGSHAPPSGLSLEAQDAEGRWVVVATGLGFPAGKNKTVLLDLGALRRAGVAEAHRLRLRTNLEIYWDAIGLAFGAPNASLSTRTVAAAGAELRYRGFSTTTGDRRSPESPDYARLANVAPRWRDLEGYYTRYGDVRPLLAAADDRYVIMNAGDELRLSFPAPPAPPVGWTRDFVLVGDGWNKDGDFNTSASRTVLPLPEHGRADYPGPSAPTTLQEDPVYRRHADDWQTFHTRYVDPRPFLDGLFLRADRR